MIYIEVPLWLAIIDTVCLFLCFVYFMVGDFLAKVIYKKIKEEIEKEKIEWVEKILTEENGKELEK